MHQLFRQASRALFSAVLLSAALSVGGGAGSMAASALANEESAGIVFLAKATSEGSTNLWGAKADGSEAFPIREMVAPGGAFMREPALSPDGRSVAVAYANKIGVVDVESGELTVVYNGTSVNNPAAAHPRWSPSGERLIFVADVSTASLEALRGHVYTVKSNGTDLQTLSLSLPFGQTRVRDPSYSPSGRRIVFVTFTDQARGGHIYTAKSNGTGLKLAYTDPHGESSVTQLRATTYSPDGGSILFARAGDEFELEVHRVPANGGAAQQLTDEVTDPGSNDYPTWLPSGTTIAYSNYDYRNEEPEDQQHVKVMDADGENPESLLTGFYATWEPSYRQPEHNEALENEELLTEFAPALRYDTQESYRTDSPMEITDLWGSDEGLWTEGEDPYTNRLWSGIGEDTEIARSSPELEPGQFPLTLASLGPTYPNSLEATEDDWVDERNDHYAEDAQELEGRPGYVNRDYGRAVALPNGELWLQYWFFYYYDDSSFWLSSIGSHEGDWEMMMVKLDKSRAPVEVVYAQHEDGARCAWNETESTGEGQPIAYVAVGTHATYPLPGDWDLPSGVPENDHADGEGGIATPLVETVADESPSWVAWPGRWGGTTPGIIEGEATSPNGPAQHSQWNDPDGFAEEVAECYERYDSFRGARAAAPAEPGLAPNGTLAAPEILSAVHRGRRVVVTYSLPDGVDRRRAALLLSVNVAGGSTAPLTESLKHPRKRGKVRLSFEVGPDQEGTVLVSLVQGPDRSPVTRAPIE